MAEMFVEVTLGIALEALLEAVSQARERAYKYECILAQLQLTIHSITPKINELNRLSKEEFPDDDDDIIPRIHLQLIRGKELVDKCSKVGCCNSCTGCKSQKYYRKLQELDESLRRLITIDLQVKVALDVMRVKAEMRALCERWDQMNVQESRGSGWTSYQIGSRTQVLRIFSGVKRFVLYTPSRIIQNLFAFFRKRSKGYGRLTDTFCPKLPK